MRHTTRTMPSVRWPWATWAWVQLLQRFRCWSWLELTWPWRHTQNKIDNQQFQKVTIRSSNKACSINYLEVQGHTTRTVVRHHIGTRASLCCLQSQETSNFFKRFSISWTIQMETWNNPVLRQEFKWTQSLKEQRRENNCNTNPWRTMKTRKQGRDGEEENFKHSKSVTSFLPVHPLWADVVPWCDAFSPPGAFEASDLCLAEALRRWPSWRRPENPAELL